MKNTKTLGLMLLASGIVALIAACASQMGIEPSTGAAVRIDNDDIGAWSPAPMDPRPVSG